MPPIIIAIVAAVVIVGDAVSLMTGHNPLEVLLLGPVSLALPASKRAKPQTPQAFVQAAQGRLVSNHSSIETHKIIYGQVRVSGVLGYINTATVYANGRNNDNINLYALIALAGHECDSVVNYYVNEDIVTLDSNGWVIAPAKYLAKSNSTINPGAGKSRIRITFHNGSPNQQADTNWVQEIPKWDSSHRLQGIAYLAIKMEKDDNVMPNGEPNFSVELKGKKVYDPRTGLTQYSNNSALCILDYCTNSQNDSHYSYGLDAHMEDEIDVDSFIAAANACDEQVELGDLNGTISYTNSSKTVTGNGTAFTVSLRIGQNVIDTANNVTIGVITSIESDTSLTLVNNFSGTSRSNVTYNYALTQARYTADGVVDTASNPADILHEMASSMGGVVPFCQGKFWCHAGVYTAPVASVDESWLAGDVAVTSGPTKAQLFNAIKGTFVDPTQRWQPVDFPAITNSFYEEQDGGDRLFTDISLPFTTDVQRAQRLAKLQLDKARQPITVELQCNYSALQLTVHDAFYLSLEQFGWVNKIFRVTEWDLNDSGGFTIIAQEESSASYDWDKGDAILFDTAVNTNLPSVNVMDVPGTPQISESTYVTSGGKGLGVKATITWAESPNALATTYVVEYQGPNDADFIFLEQTANTTSTIYDLTTGTYNFRVKAVSWRNSSSDYVTVSQEIIGLTIPPQNISNFAISTVHNQAHLTWTQAPEEAVKIGGSIEIRYSPKVTGATWNNGTALGPDLPGVATNATLPLKTGTYLIKSKTFNGLMSPQAISVVTTEANLFVLSQILTQTESPTFPGTKTNLYVNSDDSTLGFVSSGLFDDELGLFDDKVGDFDTGSGNYVESGEYLFSNYIDMGAVYTTRINGTLDFLIYDAINTFDSASGLFDDRAGLFDGADVGKITGTWYIKTTNSNPTGSVPTDGIWSDWVILPAGVGDINARAYWLKIVFENLDTSITFKATTISASTQVGTRQESFTNNSIISSGVTLTYSRPFFQQPAIRYDIQSASDGDQMIVSHITSGGKYTGLNVQVKNGGIGVTRTCNIFADGF